METGKIINRISNRLQRFAPDTQNKLGIGQVQAIILRFLLVEGQKRDIYQVDIEKEQFMQIAAVSLTNPIFILFMAFANMFGMGGSAAASIAMGEKNEKRMKNISRIHLRTGINRLYCSYIIGIFMEKGSKKFRIERNL